MEYSIVMKEREASNQLLEIHPRDLLRQRTSGYEVEDFTTKGHLLYDVCHLAAGAIRKQQLAICLMLYYVQYVLMMQAHHVLDLSD